MGSGFGAGRRGGRPGPGPSTERRQRGPGYFLNFGMLRARPARLTVALADSSESGGSQTPSGRPGGPGPIARNSHGAMDRDRDKYGDFRYVRTVRYLTFVALQSL